MAAFVIGAVVLSVAALTLIYWGTSYPFEWHLRTSADRVVTTPLLLAVSFAAVLIDSVVVPSDVRGAERLSAWRQLLTVRRRVSTG